MILVWHYRDLRIEDHPPLVYAHQTGLDILSLYIHDSQAEKNWEAGGASKWWLHYSLKSLAQEYQKIGGHLVVREGDAKKILEKLIQEYEIQEITWNQRFEPLLLKRDEQIAKMLKSFNIAVSVFNGNYLTLPTEVQTASNEPYKVFTPFSRAFLEHLDVKKPLKAPKEISARKIPSDTLDLLPKIHWDKKLEKYWTPGRKGAEKALHTFIQKGLDDYKVDRDFMAKEGTSKLSSHLAFGEISPREIWTACASKKKKEPYLRQLIWREFANSFLYYFPDSTDISWKEEFEKLPWEKSKKRLEAWQKGQTGYPIVDAAMRELWETGWMHNRARMIVGSFLVKDLHIHWIEWAKWFWDTLVDANLGNNTLGWQWVAGSGPDAAPYFRIFNPLLQSEKFDPKAEYIRKYVPELKNLSDKWIHAPFKAPEEVLKKAKVVLGKTYPMPIVDHQEERQIALEYFEKIKKR